VAKFCHDANVIGVLARTGGVVHEFWRRVALPSGARQRLEDELSAPVVGRRRADPARPRLARSPASPTSMS
jgi:hypothetical protein